jgi:uncharacterized membrane protein YkoI
MSNQKGFSAVEGLLVVIVIGVIGFSGYYVVNRNNNETQLSVDTTESSELSEELPIDLEGLKTIEEIETVAGVSDTVSMLSYKLESSDSKTEYVVILSNGKKLVIDARTGEILSEEDTDVSSLSSSIPINVSLKEAYALATARYQSPVKDVEFEVEDTKATYKIEYLDGSKVEIDASTGSIVKSETKNEEYEDSSDEDSEDEREEEEYEDSSDEDSEDEREEERES